MGTDVDRLNGMACFFDGVCVAVAYARKRRCRSVGGYAGGEQRGRCDDRVSAAVRVRAPSSAKRAFFSRRKPIANYVSFRRDRVCWPGA